MLKLATENALEPQAVLVAEKNMIPKKHNY
jgi:hypothetical protein